MPDEGGDAAATPDAPTSPPGPAPDAPPAQPEEDWKARYESTLAESRKWEDRAKKALAAQKELDELKRQGMTEVEKATTEAHAKGIAEARQQFGARLVDAEVKAAAAGRQVDIDALLDGLDRARFLTEDGEPDVKQITKWVERIAPQPVTASPLDLGQGGRGTPERAPDMNDAIRQRMRR